jgi:hypothetical protein
MLRALFLLAFMMSAQSGLACSVKIGGERSADLQDRAAQRALVAELTTQADTILLATANTVEKSLNGETAQFQVKEVLKGTLKEGDVVIYPLPQLGTIGGGVASMFKNTWAREGVTYLIYVHDGQLLRTGELQRVWPEISLREEMRRVRKQVKRA